jgi:transcriptional regulator GlxA family with amidase domain
MRRSAVFAARGSAVPFRVQLVGLSRETRLAGGLYSIYPDCVLDEVSSTDLVIIPALDGEIESALRINKDLIPWIVEQYRQGSEVASLCMGAFLLASTGLLDGKSCATHWMAANAFRAMFPNVHLVTEKIITDEHGLYSSGGAYSYQNLILYLIEKYVGREMAVLTAKTFAIEIERTNQASFIIFQGQKDHDDVLVARAQEYIETHYQDKMTVDGLADMLSLNRRSLERRFKKATANSVGEYLRRVRIEAAKASLESSRETVNEAMYDAGYNDPKAFRSALKKMTGLSPIQYRNKYCREVLV